MKAKLTQRLVNGAEYSRAPGAPAVQYVWDTEITGFALRLLPSGKKQYYLAYRQGGRQRFMPVATVGQVTLVQAREMAQGLFARIKLGEDPLAERQARRRWQVSLPTVAQLAERYMQHVSGAKGNTAKTVRDKQRMWDAFVLPALGEVPCSEVRSEQVERLHSSLADKPVAANRLLALLQHAFGLAERWHTAEGVPWVPPGTNPVRGIQRFREKRRQRAYSEAEMVRIWTALAELEAQQGVSPAAAGLLRLLVLTGARPGEFVEPELGARWEHLDEERRVIRLPHAKADRDLARGRRIYLPQQAMPVLERLREVRNGPFLIAGGVRHRPLSTLKQAWARVRDAAGLQDQSGARPTPYVLRHSWATFAQLAGLAQPEAGWLMGHLPRSMTETYTHLPDQHWTTKADQVGAYLAALLGGA